jgi:hypothetical protein
MRTRTGSRAAGGCRGVGERQEERGGDGGQFAMAGRSPAVVAQWRGEREEEDLADTMFGELFPVFQP